MIGCLPWQFPHGAYRSVHERCNQVIGSSAQLSDGAIAGYYSFAFWYAILLRSLSCEQYRRLRSPACMVTGLICRIVHTFVEPGTR